MPSPRRSAELTAEHPKQWERQYHIVARISLGRIDYENLTEDLRVSREYLARVSRLCRDGEPCRCVLVRRRGCRGDGLLILPDRGGRIVCAAAWRDGNGGT